MPTFRPVVRGAKKNGERSVVIRMIHERHSRNIPTGISAMPTDVRGNKLTNGRLIDKVNGQMRDMRERCNRMGSALIGMPIDDVARIAMSADKFEDDFLKFCDTHLDRLRKEGRSGTRRIHTSAVNSLKRYTCGKPLRYKDITAAYLREYRDWLDDIGERASFVYFSIIGTIFREARTEYNDTTDGTPRIHNDPFDIVKPSKVGDTRKRALSLSDVIRIRDYSGPMNRPEEVARDMFMLSFYLAGINCADLFDLRWKDADHVEYNRRKTRTRRKDQAYMCLYVPDEARPIIEKYKDRHGEYALDFRNSMSDCYSLSIYVGKGMRKIGSALGIKGLTYYAARHTWATVAVNDCGIDVYVVGKALCHKSVSMSVTEVYIKPDFTRVDNANRIVLDRLEEEGM